MQVSKEQSIQIDEILGFSPILVYDWKGEGEQEDYIFTSPYNPERTKEILVDLIGRIIMPRHKEDKLNGVVEAALSHVMLDETWLMDMANDVEIEQNSPDEVFRALEGYVTDSLARIGE